MGTISQHFSYREFEATSYKNLQVDNIIRTVEVRDNIKELVEVILEPLREAWGSPLTITSGYRCKALNEAVGGSATSAHTKGLAADLQPARGKTVDQLFSFMRTWLKSNNVKFDQLIIERNRRTGAKWVHIGYKNLSGLQREQVKSLVK